MLTDGYTPFGDDPGYPVLWGITSEAIVAGGVPHGKALHIQTSDDRR